MSISTDLKDDELSIGKLIRKKRKEKATHNKRSLMN